MSKVRTQIATYNVFFGKLRQKVKRRHLVEIFARFTCYKLAYKNSKIYDYTPSKVVSQGRVEFKSRETVKRHVNEFIELGLAYMEGSTLVLTQKKTASFKFQTKEPKHTMYIKIEHEPNFKSTKQALLAAITESKIRQQIKSKNTKEFRSFVEEYSKQSIKKSFVKPIELVPKYISAFSEGDEVEIGLHKLAEFYGYKSISCARKASILACTDNENMERRVSEPKYIGPALHILEKGERPKNVFITNNGFMFEQPCTRFFIPTITESEYPKLSRAMRTKKR